MVFNINMSFKPILIFFNKLRVVYIGGTVDKNRRDGTCTWDVPTAPAASPVKGAPFPPRARMEGGLALRVAGTGRQRGTTLPAVFLSASHSKERGPE